MEFSTYQIDIFEAVQNTRSNLIVEAVAGSGKSTTLVEICKRLPMGNHMFCAFNKLIADELTKKLDRAGAFNVKCSTLNSYGYMLVRNQFGRVRMNQYKTDDLIKDIVPQQERKYVWSFISRMVSLMKGHMVKDVYNFQATGELDDLMVKQGIERPKNKEAFGWLCEVYNRSIKDTKSIDFDDMLLYPILYNIPIKKFDTLLVDESQDLNPVQIELCMRSAKRMVAVGDSRQGIYGFRGADPEAIANMRQRLDSTPQGCKVLPLSICYRCPVNVVEAAKAIVPQIEPSPTAVQGLVETVTMARFNTEAKVGDFVLCRTTAPLVSNCLRFIREGKYATVRGRDIGKQLDSLVTRIAGGNDFKPINDFITDLDAYSRAEMARLGAIGREMEIQALEDRVATLEALSAAVVEMPNASVSNIKYKINEIFSDNNEGIVFSTVHKAKGLEARNIWILHPEQMPHKNAKLPWQIEQEMNLKYVAITRATEALRWVK